MEETSSQSTKNFEMLIRLDEKVDLLSRDLKEIKDGTKQDVVDLKKEIALLKTFKDNLTGKYTVLAILGSVFISTIASLVTRFIVN